MARRETGRRRGQPREAVAHPAVSIGRIRGDAYLFGMARSTHLLVSPEETMAILRALGDRRRYEIVRELAAADSSTPCCTLAQAGQVRASTMSHHLQQLEQAGLIDVSRDGKFAVLRFARARYEAFLRRLAEDTRPAVAAIPRPAGLDE